MTWLYIQSERPTSDHPYALYTVGHYAPDGTWHAESDHSKADDAAERVAWLNGGGVADGRQWSVVLLTLTRARDTIRTLASGLSATATQLDDVIAMIKRGVQ